ncbi:hypothetical protein [Cryobacterium zongtaii]|uniref:hypothetical protein n=1 Tax=Cryobacterium zongtaii TaxID=1259217 RepID=UPI000CD3D371|nr:hypothetical protein [Cryobacterium zongtaii]
MNTKSSLSRPRWYAAAVVGGVVAIAALSTAAILVDHDPADSVLGFLTGMLSVLLVTVILWTEIGRQRVARLRDTVALDNLEPLRDATDAESAGQRLGQRRDQRTDER